MPANDDSERPTTVWTATAVGGVVLVLVGFVWQALAPSEAWLSEEQAKAHVEAVVALHGRTMTESPADSPELLADRQRLAETQAAVEAAQSRRVWWPRTLQIVGAVAALVGGFGLRAAR